MSEFPYLIPRARSVESRLYRISSGASTPIIARPAAKTCALARISARRAAVRSPVMCLYEAQMWRFIAPRPQSVGKLKPNHRDRTRCGAARGRARRPRPGWGRPRAYEFSLDLARVLQQRQVGAGNLRRLLGQLRKGLQHIAEHRFGPGVRVLNIEYRVVLRLLHHLGEVEIERRVILAIQHHEAHGIAADLVHHLAQGHERAGALGHAHGLAGPEQAHQLAHLDVEHGLAVRQGRHDRLHARQVARVIGAEHVDEVLEAARQLVVMISHVGGEIGVAAVGLHQRAVDVVAERGRLEQRLLAVLPVAVVVALRLLQPLEHEPHCAQLRDRLGHLVLALRQRPLGRRTPRDGC